MVRPLGCRRGRRRRHGRARPGDGAGPGDDGRLVDRLGPDGRLVTTGDQITVHDPDGAARPYRSRGGNETAAIRAATCTSTAPTSTSSAAAPEPGWIHLVAPDGSHRQVADEIDSRAGWSTCERT